MWLTCPVFFLASYPEFRMLMIVRLVLMTLPGSRLLTPFPWLMVRRAERSRDVGSCCRVDLSSKVARLECILSSFVYLKIL